MVIIGNKGCAREMLTALKWDDIEEDVFLFDNINTDTVIYIMNILSLSPGMNWRNT